MSTSTLARSNTEREFMMKLVREFQKEEGHAGPVNLADVAVWALNNHKWNPPRQSLVADLKKRLSRAARRQFHTDKQGRRVRTMHAARYAKATEGGQMVFETIWDELETMSMDHARISYTQRWDQIAHECKSLNRDNLSFADNNVNAQGHTVPLTFNFEFVVDESPLEQQIDKISESAIRPKGH